MSNEKCSRRACGPKASRLPDARLRSRQYFAPHFPLLIMDVAQGPMEEHSHEFWEMVYVRRGRGEHSIAGRMYPIQAGDLYVIAPGERHRYAPTPGCELRIVNVLWLPSLVEEAVAECGSPQSTLRGAASHVTHRLHLSGRAAFRIETLLDEMRREQERALPGSETLRRHLFCALQILLTRARAAENAAGDEEVMGADRSLTSGQEIVERVIEWLEANASQAVKICDVASHVAISPSRLSHLFKAHTGRGVIEYLHELRIARACAALGHSALPVQQIAADSGFNDSRFFHRVFRRHTGCNPTQYRQHFGRTESDLERA